MKTYRIGNAIVNISGDVDRERIREATVVFMKKVYKCKKKEKKQNGDCN